MVPHDLMPLHTIRSVVILITHIFPIHLRISLEILLETQDERLHMINNEYHNYNFIIDSIGNSTMFPPALISSQM